MQCKLRTSAASHFTDPLIFTESDIDQILDEGVVLTLSQQGVTSMRTDLPRRIKKLRGEQQNARNELSARMVMVPLLSLLAMVTDINGDCTTFQQRHSTCRKSEWGESSHREVGSQKSSQSSEEVAC